MYTCIAVYTVYTCILYINPLTPRSRKVYIKNACIAGYTSRKTIHKKSVYSRCIGLCIAQKCGHERCCSTHERCSTAQSRHFELRCASERALGVKPLHARGSHAPMLMWWSESSIFSVILMTRSADNTRKVKKLTFVAASRHRQL